MSENANIIIDLVIALFFCIGLIYFFRDVCNFLTRKTVKTRATLTLVLSSDKNEATKELLEITTFYHNCLAQRYIEKIVLLNAPKSLTDEKEHLIKALKLPLDFKDP